MKLSSFSDYGLRLLILLASTPGRRWTTAEAAEAHAISRNHLVKIAQRLGQMGVLDLTRGRGGGLALARDPAELSVGALLRELEHDGDFVECFTDDDHCVISPACTLKGPLARALDAFYGELDGVTVADLVARRQSRLRGLLGSN